MQVTKSRLVVPLQLFLVFQSRPTILIKIPVLRSLRTKSSMSTSTIGEKVMLASTVRVTGTTTDEWTVTKEPATTRYSTVIMELQEGKKESFAKLAARVFRPDGCRDFEHNKSTLNRMLDLHRRI